MKAGRASNCDLRESMTFLMHSSSRRGSSPSKAGTRKKKRLLDLTKSNLEKTFLFLFKVKDTLDNWAIRGIQQSTEAQWDLNPRPLE